MAAMLLFVILPATEAQIFNQTTIAGSDERAGVVRALEITALAQCGMLAGAITARTLWRVPSFNQLSLRLSSSRLDRAARRSIFAAILGIVAFSALGGASLRSFFTYTTSGGYGTFIREATGNLIFLMAAQCIAGLAVVLLPLRLGSAGSNRLSTPLFWATLAAFVLLGGGQRARLFVPVFAAGLVWLKCSKGSRHPRRIAAVGMIVMVVLSGFVGVARGSADSRDVTLKTVLTQPFGSGNNLFLPLAGMASVVPGQFPYLDGTSYLQTAVYLVPRALWSGKPQDAVVSLTRTFDNGAGLAIPEFGEMYVNFGLPGVIVGSLLLGVLIELLSIRFARSMSIRESVFIAVCSAVLLDIFTRGAVAPILTTFDPLLVATALVCRRRSPVLAVTHTPALSEPLAPGKSRCSVVRP